MTLVYASDYVQLHCLFGASYTETSRENFSCILAVITILGFH